MKKNDLIKRDEKINFDKVWLLLQIKDFLIEEGIKSNDVCEFDSYLMIYTDEKYNYYDIINQIRDLNLDSIEVDDSSDKASLISLK
jgi:hypothetical protein